MSVVVTCKATPPTVLPRVSVSEAKQHYQVTSSKPVLSQQLAKRVQSGKGSQSMGSKLHRAMGSGQCSFLNNLQPQSLSKHLLTPPQAAGSQQAVLAACY